MHLWFRLNRSGFVDANEPVFICSHPIAVCSLFCSILYHDKRAISLLECVPIFRPKCSCKRTSLWCASIWKFVRFLYSVWMAIAYHSVDSFFFRFLFVCWVVASLMHTIYILFYTFFFLFVWIQICTFGTFIFCAYSFFFLLSFRAIFLHCQYANKYQFQSIFFAFIYFYECSI